MKKRKKKYKTPIWRNTVYAVEVPFGSGSWWFVYSGLYKWLMQHRYKCDWRIRYQRAGKRSKKKD